MTLPDVASKTRNAFAILGILGAALSYATASAAGFWITPVDYWYIWATILLGFGGFFALIGAVVSHMIYLDTLRSN